MKTVRVFLLIFLCIMSAALPAYGAEGKVIYDGNAREFIFQPGSAYSPTDLFPDFKDVMPGDALTQKILVQNDISRDVKVKIYLRSLGAQEGSEAFLSQLGLTVQTSADNEMAYMFDATADQTDGLTDWVCLGTLYSGGEVNLDVTLRVPLELDNAYQNQIGLLDWEFKVEELSVDSSDPKPPQTGESFDPGLWVLVAFGSLGLLIFLFLWRKRDKETTETNC